MTVIPFDMSPEFELLRSRIPAPRFRGHVGQGRFFKQMSFGSRLAEERKRLGLKQAGFAALVGTDVPKQSLYENDRRELRADYLARLAEAEVDVLYILTGKRSEGEWLSEGTSELLSAYLSLPVEVQVALERFARSLRDECSRPHAGIIEPQSEYKAEGDGAEPRRFGEKSDRH